MAGSLRTTVPNTQAYLRLKAQTQGVFDFIVVVAYGVTSLRRNLALLEKGDISRMPLPNGFHEGNNTPEQLRAWSTGYREQVASYAILSLFSFFESFVAAAIAEMIDFHGGGEEFQRKAKAHDRRFLNDDPALERNKRPLRGDKASQPGRAQRQAKFTAELVATGYRFPTELFSGYGARVLIQKLGNLRAADIPDLLRHGLHMDIDDARKRRFDEVRSIRNKIAHGDRVSLSFRDVSQKNEVLRKLSFDVDRHLMAHFMISERHL